MNRASRPITSRNGVRKGASLTAVGYSFSLPLRKYSAAKKQDAGCQSSQKKIKRYLPVPDIEMWIHQGIHPPADNYFFFHIEFTVCNY